MQAQVLYDTWGCREWPQLMGPGGLSSSIEVVWEGELT